MSIVHQFVIGVEAELVEGVEDDEYVERLVTAITNRLDASNAWVSKSMSGTYDPSRCAYKLTARVRQPKATPLSTPLEFPAS